MLSSISEANKIAQNECLESTCPEAYSWVICECMPHPNQDTTVEIEFGKFNFTDLLSII